MIKKSFIFMFLFIVGMIAFSNNEISAYSYRCDEYSRSDSDNENFICSSSTNIVINPGDGDSSTFRSGSQSDILQIVDENEDSTFYTTSFDIRAVGYDAYAREHNRWINIYRNNVKIFDGEFSTNYFQNNSYVENFSFDQDNLGYYRIDQYVDAGDYSHSIDIYVVNSQDLYYEINEIGYGEFRNLDVDREPNNVIKSNTGSPLYFYLGTNLLGSDGTVSLEINGDKRNPLNSAVHVYSDYYAFNYSPSSFHDVIKINRIDGNNINTFEFTLRDLIGRKFVITLEIEFYLEDLSITMATTPDTGEYVTSKRYDLLAVAGIDRTDYSFRTIDEENLYYYWSKSPSAPVNPDTFFQKYEEANIKGQYVNGGSVTLRNKEGVFYLYAYAQDLEGVQYYIGKSEPVAMELPTTGFVSINSSDLIFASFVFAVTLVPIAGYVFFKSKNQKDRKII